MNPVRENKIIIGIIIVIVAMATAGFLIFKKKSPAPASPQPPETNFEQTVKPTPSVEAPFDTNDNLDQALEEINQIK